MESYHQKEFFEFCVTLTSFRVYLFIFFFNSADGSMPSSNVLWKHGFQSNKSVFFLFFFRIRFARLVFLYPVSVLGILLTKLNVFCGRSVEDLAARDGRIRTALDYWRMYQTCLRVRG